MKPNNPLEQELFESVKKNTPDYIKNNVLIDISNKNKFIFRLKKEHLYEYNENLNPQGLNLKNWLINYMKEAQVSTAGIRGPQNILWPDDTRFPINTLGIALATLAKALVAKENYPDSKLVKIAGREVRYNSDKFLELIARVQAAQGIETFLPVGRKTIPIWLASFLAFKLDLIGGEYITASHSISVKNATKDLNNQGSQYLPDESNAFVKKICDIFDIVEKEGYYDIEIAENENPLINENYMEKIDDGISLYKEYLHKGVGNDFNIQLINSLNKKIIIENVGGCAYRTLSKLLLELKISDRYDWLNTNEDSFFHGIGKFDKDEEGNSCFYDYSVDATVVAYDSEFNKHFPVIETLNYDKKLKDYPLLTPILITDPDHDRLTICQIEDKKNILTLDKAGIDYVDLGNERVLSILSANQSFLLIMDFWTKQLKNSNLFNNHPRFIIKTTASSMTWDEWAEYNNVKVVNVPVGFKEIASVMKNVEAQMKNNPEKDVLITDVFENNINLGTNPRVLFAGEESGGMIIGAEEIIKSKAGREAIAMREKSATEAIIIASALVSKLEKQNKPLSQALIELHDKNNIKARYDVREDISYYNESEPDINKLVKAKKEGEAKRTKNDLFFLSIAVAKHKSHITLEDAKNILNSTFENLDFSDLIDIRFVNDGTYLKFTDKFIEIRPSGTDAKTKAYAGGKNKDEVLKFASTMGHYEGNLNEKYIELIGKDYYNKSKDLCVDICKNYIKTTYKDNFQVPDYNKTLEI